MSANHVAFTWPAADSGDVAAYVVRIDGDFIPNLGIQLGLEVALQTMPHRSILVTLEAQRGERSVG